MIGENDLFRILLSFENIYRLYFNLGNSIRTENDMAGYSLNRDALKNTVTLLFETGFIENVDGVYSKRLDINGGEEAFNESLAQRIFEKYKEEIYELLRDNVKYDTQGTFSIYKNSIPLKYSGLVMLLNSFGELCSAGNTWVLCGANLKKLFVKETKKHRMSLAELEKKLLVEKELGQQAEEFVLDYEKKRLEQMGINKEPIQISLIDVSAGFDILSYDKNGEEKYIEVKSCDNRYRFHFSANEVEVS